MNQDLAFELTPAKARKLMKASELCKTDIDSDILKIAKQDLVGIDASVEELELMQFVSDTDFRCTICAPALTRTRFLNLLDKIGIETIIVTGQNNEEWKEKFVEFGIAMTHNFQAGKRNSLLIYDWETVGNENNLEIIGHEFPKTICYVSGETMKQNTNRNFQSVLDSSDLMTKLFYKGSLKRQRMMTVKHQELVKDSNFEWWHSACLLYPQMPRNIFQVSKFTLSRNILHESIWTKQDANDLAFLYNVFIPERMINYGSHREHE